MTDALTNANRLGESPDGDPDLVVTPPKERRRVLISSLVGALIEWYDFYLFGIASAVVFNVVFFPDHDPLVGSLLSFLTLAIGFLARPLGGAIWGHFGDRIGRKRMLVLSIITMGIGTFLMGLMPTYAQIGVWAPILLIMLRLVQGVSGGGEWGGAVLMAMEHSPKKRGLASSFPQIGLTGGILVANGAFALVSLLPQEDLIAWGWRIPFLASAVLVGVGLWIRLGVSESPVFVAAQKKAAVQEKAQKAPLIEVFRQPKPLILAFLLALGPFAVSAAYLTFAISYGVQVGFTSSQMLTASIIAAAVGVIGQPIFALWSDHIGRRKVVGLGLALQAFSGFLLFHQMNRGSYGGMLLTMVLIALAHAICYAPLAAWLGELFPTRLRYTGSSMAYQIAGSIGGGFTPAICSALLIVAGGPPHSVLIAVFMMVVSLLSLVAVLITRETYRDVL